MNGQHTTDKLRHILFLLGLFLASASASAQVPVDDNGEPIGVYRGDDPADDEAPLLGAGELESLVGPVALYPDDLLAIVLPASTYPLQIVQAARFLEALEQDSALEPDEDWDDSVIALLNYPEVIRMMDEDIDWTWQLGEAVISQQNDVIAAVEAFRDRAYAAGNLKSDERQKVSYDDGVIEIEPADDDVIYVPYYEPAEVVVYQPRPVYHYYPVAYPVYYYPYPVGYHFHTGYFWGVTTAFTIGWSNHYLHVYHPSYWGHPYYGRHYYGHYYRRPSITVYNNWYVHNSYRSSRHRYRDGDYWRPRRHAGSSPVTRQVVNNYHYTSNGSRHSRNYTVSRRDRLRVGADGRMDLDLRRRASAAENNRTSRTINRDRGSSRQSIADSTYTGRRATANTGRSDAVSRNNGHRASGSNRQSAAISRNSGQRTSGSAGTGSRSDRGREVTGTARRQDNAVSDRTSASRDRVTSNPRANRVQPRDTAGFSPSKRPAAATTRRAASQARSGGQPAVRQTAPTPRSAPPPTSSRRAAPSERRSQKPSVRRDEGGGRSRNSSGQRPRKRPQH